MPWALVEGFQVVGKIPESGIHRKIDCEDYSNEYLRTELLRTSATFVDELEADTRVDENAQEILEVTEEEIALGLARNFETRE